MNPILFFLLPTLIHKPQPSPTQTNDTTQDTIWMPQRKDVFLVIDVDEPDWWETAYFVTPDTTMLVPVTGNAILSAQFVEMQDAQTIYIELFDITHMGNGFYYLFAYANETLTPLLKTRAVDRHLENMGSSIDSSLTLKNDRLDCQYIHNQTGQLPDILLTGIGQLSIGEDDHIAKTIPIQKQFTYNPTTKTYHPHPNTTPNYLDNQNR